MTPPSLRQLRTSPVRTFEGVARVAVERCLRDKSATSQDGQRPCPADYNGSTVFLQMLKGHAAITLRGPCRLVSQVSFYANLLPNARRLLGGCRNGLDGSESPRGALKWYSDRGKGAQGVGRFGRCTAHYRPIFLRHPRPR